MLGEVTHRAGGRAATARGDRAVNLEEALVGATLMAFGAEADAATEVTCVEALRLNVGVADHRVDVADDLRTDRVILIWKDRR